MTGFSNSLANLRKQYAQTRLLLKKMKTHFTFLLIVFILLGIKSSVGQSLFESKGSIVSFTSDAPLENISASTTSMKGLLNTETNSFAFTIEISTFKGFNSDLQREHFNENYLESDLYPKASFEGKLIDKFNPTSSSQKIRAKGSFTIHGVKKERIIDILITKKGDSYLIVSDFSVPLKDHGIRIPKIVNQKISENISVSVKSEMVPKQ
jgi:polyisoprenoid-binding protein YceI